MLRQSHDPLWKDAEKAFEAVLPMLEQNAQDLTAVIFEPSFRRRAACMCMYSANFLHHLRAFCTQHDIHVIADEIAVGLGRTGKALACQHAGSRRIFFA